MINEHYTEIDFHWQGVEVEYDRSLCICDPGGDYCRCTSIQNVRIEIEDSDNVVKALIRDKELTPLQTYCLTRICSRLASEDFDATVTGGYYGQELGPVTLNWNTKLCTFFENLAKGRSSTDFVEAMLGAEYGFVLPQLAGLDWQILMVDIPILEGRPHTSAKKVVHYREAIREELLQGTRGTRKTPRETSRTVLGLIGPDGILYDGHHRTAGAIANDLAEGLYLIGTKK